MSVIKCPRCGSSTFHVNQEWKYDLIYVVEDDKLFKKGKGSEFPTGKIVLVCEVCCQNEDLDPAWYPSEEEKRTLMNAILEPKFVEISKCQ